MAGTNWREGSSRLTFLSTTDYTSSGTTFTPPFVQVKLDVNGKVVTATAATDKIVGTLMNCPAASDEADVLSINNMGTAKATAGGTISIGDFLTSDGSGKLIATTTAGNRVVGQATVAAVANQIVEFISCNFKY